MDKRAAYSAVFGLDVLYDDARMRRLMHQLYSLLLEFAGQQQYAGDPAAVALHQAEAMERMGMDRHLNKPLARVEAAAFRNSKSLQHRYEADLIRFNRDARSGRGKVSETRAFSESLDLYWAVSKLRHAIVDLHQRRILEEPLQINGLELAMELIEKNNWREIPLVRLHWGTYHCLAYPEESSHFDRLEAELDQFAREIDPDELRESLQSLINYAIGRINRGVAGFPLRLLKLYQFGLANGLLTGAGGLSPFTFRNIVAVAIRARELDWARSFIEEYRERIDDQYRNDYYKLALAGILFEEGDYDGVAHCVSSSRFKDKLSERNARIVLLKAMYEQGSFDLLDFQIANFRQLVNRSKLGSYHQSSHKRFIRYFSRLCKPVYRKADRRKRLTELVSSESGMSEKKWLIEKLESRS